MGHPALSELETRTQQTFTALMWALSYPGRPQSLAGDALTRFEMIGEALIDLETSYYTPDEELERRLRFSGARSYGYTNALYQFYPMLQPEHLDGLRQAPVGTYAYPDEGATIVVGCSVGEGQALRLRGPGIQTYTDLRIAGIPSDFWQVRAETLRFPLGWDVFLVAPDSVIGVPRSTTVEVL